MVNYERISVSPVHFRRIRVKLEVVGPPLEVVLFIPFGALLVSLSPIYRQVRRVRVCVAIEICSRFRGRPAHAMLRLNHLTQVTSGASI